MYTCPVAESILSHFLTSPSKEYLWKETGWGGKTIYTVPNWEKIPTKQIFLCWLYVKAWLQLYSMKGLLEELQYHNTTTRRHRQRKTKITQNKSESRPTEMPSLLQPVCLQFHFPSKWGAWAGTELLVQKCDLSKPHVRLTPSHLPHLGFDGGTSQGLGDTGASAARYPIVDQEGTRIPRWTMVIIFCQSAAACNYHWAALEQRML